MLKQLLRGATAAMRRCPGRCARRRSALLGMAGAISLAIWVGGGMYVIHGLLFDLSLPRHFERLDAHGRRLPGGSTRQTAVGHA